MPLTREQYYELEGNIQEVFKTYNDRKVDYIPQVYNVQASERAAEHHLGMGATGLMEEFKGTLSYDSAAQGYTKDYRHVPYSKAIQVESFLYEDGEFARIKTMITDTARSVYKTLQIHGASVFNNAFSSSFVGPDGKALCASDHKLTGRDDEDAQSNTGTLALSVDNLEKVLIAMRGFKDDRGDIMDVIGDTLIVGPYYEKTAKQIIGSDKEDYNANNQVNVQNTLSYVVNPYITGKKWFVAEMDAMKGGSGLNWYMRKDPRKNIMRESEFDTLMLKWASVGRWSYGWDSALFIYGNNPA